MSGSMRYACRASALSCPRSSTTRCAGSCCGSTPWGGLLRLDALAFGLVYDPITTAVMRQAAAFWADVRRRGLPTAADASLDGDAILAAQAGLLGGPGDVVEIATSNVGHLGRFPGINAREWALVI